MTRLSDELLRLVSELRAAEIPVSVAEALDAMRAVAVAGFAERTRLREALAAALVKDEADRAAFDQVFARFFGSGARAARYEGRPGGHHRTAGAGGGRGDEGALGRARAERAQPKAASGAPAGVPGPQSARSARAHAPTATETPSAAAARGILRPAAGEEQRAGAGGAVQAATRSLGAQAEYVDPEQSGLDTRRQAALRKARRTPFAAYTDLEYEAAREALAPLARRLRVRFGRRLHAARRGRIDFRRTIRASLQLGGALVDLRMRARRPRHVDLLILADVSGSVRYCSNLMLELVAGACRSFRRVRSFVFIDRLAEAEFAGGHVATEPLDMYARSDFGRVLAEVWERRAELIGRATLVVILGDGRNNRRPSRADLLRDLRRHCRAVIWLNPEPRQRWGTGDSAIFQYAREVDGLYECGNLNELESALERSFVRAA